MRASLVAQWLRIHLLMQGTRVRALVREDPTLKKKNKKQNKTKQNQSMQSTTLID